MVYTQQKIINLDTFIDVKKSAKHHNRKKSNIAHSIMAKVPEEEKDSKFGDYGSESDDSDDEDGEKGDSP